MSHKDDPTYNLAQNQRRRNRASRSRSFVANFFKTSNPGISGYVRSDAASAIPGWIWLAGGAILTVVVALIGFFIATEPIPALDRDDTSPQDGVNGADRLDQ